MDTLFENSYIRTKELAQEIYRCLFFKRPLYIVFDVLIGVLCIVNAYMYIAYHYFDSIYAFILVFLFFVIQFVLYRKSVNALVKRDNEVSHGKNICVETVVTKKTIRSTSSIGAVNEIEFVKIKKVIQTKNFILLRSEANLIYIFKKDSFSKGTAEEFLAFLKSMDLLR